MRYDLRELKRNGGHDTVPFTIADFNAYSDIETDFSPVFPIEAVAEFSETGDTVLLKVSFEADVVLKCDRCLGEFKKHIVSEENYAVGEGDSAESVSAENGSVDLDQLVWEAVCLAIPYQHICGDDCKGISQ